MHRIENFNFYWIKETRNPSPSQICYPIKDRISKMFFTIIKQIAEKKENSILCI